MERYLSAHRRRNPLDFLPLETRQKLVDSLYDPNHIYQLHRSVRHGSITLMLSYLTPIRQPQELVTVTVAEILERCPPSLSVAPLINVKNPPFLPVWLCYAHGKQSLVYTLEELRQQPEGAAPTPLGHWPAGYGDPWLYDWQNGKGPYAPCTSWEQYNGAARGAAHVVYARHPLVYNGWARSFGEIFLLEGFDRDYDLVADQEVRVVSSRANPVPHPTTGRGFLEQSMLYEYTQRYETADLSGFEPFMLPLPDAALALVPDIVHELASAPPRPGRPPHHTREEFHTAYENLYVNNGKKHPTYEQLRTALKVGATTVRNYKKNYGLPFLPK